jgi:hypothetical protein
MAYEELKKHGITADTPENLMLGAGIVCHNLEFDSSTSKWKYDVLGATQGGNKVSIVPEITTVEADGALVKIKGLDRKTGETAKMETNLIEITPELMKAGVIGKNGTSDITGYNLITSKPDIEAGDYYKNFGFVGKKTDGTPVIVIFDNALCTSGFEAENKNKEATVVKCTFECYQECNAETDLSILPYRIYYPTPATQTEQN